jgi:hypothetical protein
MDRQSAFDLTHAEMVADFGLGETIMDVICADGGWVHFEALARDLATITDADAVDTALARLIAAGRLMMQGGGTDYSVMEPRLN